MARLKVPYKAGDAFAVPLPGGGFALGAISHTHPKGGILAYFFGPRVPTIPEIWRIPPPAKAVWISKVGDLHFLNGTWAVVKTAGGEDPTTWPVPAFVQTEPFGISPTGAPTPGLGRVWREEYDDPFENPIRRRQVGPEEARTLSESGLAGALFAEKRLERILSQK